MKKVIVVDARKNILSDIQTRMILDDERNIDIVSTLSTTENVYSAISQHKPHIVAVCENLVETQENWDYKNIQVVGYAFTPGGNDVILGMGLPSYGVISEIPVLLDRIEKNNPRKPAPSPTQKSKPIAQKPETVPETDTPPEPKPKPTSAPPSKPAAHGRNIKKQLALYNDTERARKATDDLVDSDVLGPPKKTSVVTLYSAKGGVGKTTLSTEIAVYLAMTAHRRGHYRVCIVDYNIDFGDVQTTLDLSPSGSTMTLWAAEIKERLEAGEHPDDIHFTRKEIENNLQVMDKTGLYALLAPLTHEDSMDIGEVELQVMLRNIVRHGGFDFVVCDTGNNTRDSSVTALEFAEYVLLIVTQDITAANCNDAVLATLNKIHFDTGKIRLVVNNVLPAKITGVAVQEIEDLFPHDCIARIRHDTDVIRANNYSRPIVYQPNHEVTKEIRKIIAFLTGSDEEGLTVKKRGFFSRFRK